LTGQVPFQGSTASILAKILVEQPKPVSVLRPAIAPALAAICHKAMAKKPADRYGSMRQLAQALQDFLQRPTAAPTPQPAPVEATAPVLEDERDTVVHPDRSAPNRVEEALPAGSSGPATRSWILRRRAAIPAWVWVALASSAAVIVLLVGVLVALNLPRNPLPAVPPPGGQNPPRVESTPPGWKKWAPAEGGFAVLLPGKPREEKASQDTPKGKTETHMYILEDGRHLYTVAYADLPGVIPRGPDIDKALEGGREGMLRSFPQAKLRQEKKIELAGYPGRGYDLELIADGKRFLLRMRMYLVNQRLFQVLAQVPEEESGLRDLEIYFGSFELVSP
jgi:hypothetical protein